MSMIGASSLFCFAAVAAAIWWCRWNSKNHDTKLSNFMRAKGPPGFSSGTPSRLTPRVLRRVATNELNDVCMNSSKNFRRPPMTSSPMTFEASSAFFTCVLSWLWSRTEPSSRSTKNGSWNMLTFLSFLASGSWNSRRHTRPPLVIVLLSMTEVRKVVLPSAVLEMSEVPKRLCLVDIGIRSRVSACSRARRSFRTFLSFPLLPYAKASGSECVQIL
mmetsp:Transcript_41959/g.118736  ORF Transcript_41959/g.118736 Transcript_41959/m.118736 type:complete len:217 (-) Transcript_41959:751-1401(-)